MSVTVSDYIDVPERIAELGCVLYPSEQAHSFAELASVLNSGHEGYERKVGKQAPELRRDGTAGAGV
jgi:hypothetical protein